MEACPRCSTPCIPAWRRSVGSRQRFRCPACATWLGFERARPEVDAASWAARHPGLFSALAGVGTPLAIGVFVGGALFMTCRADRHVLGTAACVVLAAASILILRAEWRQRSRATLAVAAAQDGWPSLDAARELGALARVPAGRRFYLALLVYLLTFGATAAAMSLALAHLHLPHAAACARANGQAAD